jgi:transposase
MSLEADRKLVRHRQRLQQDITRCQVRIKSFLRFAGIDLPEDITGKYWSAAYIQWLKGLDIHEPTAKLTLNYMIEQVEALRPQLLKVMRDIRALIQSERYSKAATYLMSVCGIGPITAITLLTEVGDIRRFPNFNAFNSFIGFCPTEFSSGEHIRHGRITNRHHYTLRRLIIEAAWIAIKADPALSAAYLNFKTRMGGKRAIIRIARKLLNRLYHTWLNERMYEKGIAL